MNLTPSLQVMRPMIAAAVRGAASLIPAERADVYEGIAVASQEWDPVMSEQALTLAKAIRDAESLQMHFLNVFAEPSQS